MNGGMRLLVYPAKDMASAKTLFKALLGVEPYIDGSYYAGFRTGDVEIGLDPNGRSAGPIAYWEVEDIGASLQLLVARTRAYDQKSNEIPRRRRWQVQ